MPDRLLINKRKITIDDFINAPENKLKDKKCFSKLYGAIYKNFDECFEEKNILWGVVQHSDKVYFLINDYGNTADEDIYSVNSIYLIVHDFEKILLKKKIYSSKVGQFNQFENTSMYLIKSKKEKKHYIDIFLGVLGAHYTAGIRFIIDINNNSLPVLLSEYDYNFPNTENKYFEYNNEVCIWTARDKYKKGPYSCEADRLDKRYFVNKYYIFDNNKLKLINEKPKIKIGDSPIILKSPDIMYYQFLIIMGNK